MRIPDKVLALATPVTIAGLALTISISAMCVVEAIDNVDKHLTRFDEMSVRLTENLRQIDQAKQDAIRSGSAKPMPVDPLPSTRGFRLGKGS